MKIEQTTVILSTFVYIIRRCVSWRFSLQAGSLGCRVREARELVFGPNDFRRKNRFLRLSAVSLLAAMAAGCALPRYEKSLNEVLEQKLGKNRTEIYGYRCTEGAHRGASVEHMENTLAALKAADEDSKYAFIEFDVQYSKDNKIVVFHDKRLLRLFGNLSAIGNTTFAELSDLTGGEVSAYPDVMDVLQKKVNIEIKSQGDPEEDERLADEIIADIQARKRDKDVLISSISSDVIKYINRKYPEIPTGQVFWLTSSTYLHFDILTKALYEKFNATQADYLMLYVANLRNIEDLLKFKPKGKTIVFWDFDDTMYLVHKDFSDRLWGDSGIKAFFQHIKYELLSPFQHRKHSK
jgi:glycerophosphoryl diester phosphodiesterase